MSSPSSSFSSSSPSPSSAQPTPESSALRIRSATEQDAARLSAFGRRIFDETFRPMNRPDDLDAYLAEAFSPELQRAEIADPTSIVLIADRGDDAGPASGAERGAHAETASSDEAIVAYSHLVAGAGDVPDVVQGPQAIELKRFYVDPAWHGRGVARVLMQATIDAAVARGARTMWLGVWEHNPRAQAFYRKWGFTQVGAHDFMLGADRQTDLLMARAIG